MQLNYTFRVILLVLLYYGLCANALNLEAFARYTWTDQRFYAFTGIRYAQPPVGPLRFQAPVAFEPSWNLTSISEIETNSDGGSPCPSPYVLGEQSEDCLYLNVYTKDIAARSPVVVFIHPGGFYIMSGRPEHFGPEYLLDQDVVLITFNYRLGFLGFTNSVDSNVTGNAGLKDQALVLRWIAQNIRQFGGDPDNVSIMGASAGAMSVALHLVSPLSQGLFHRAIVMSGGILPQTKFPLEQKELFHRQAQLLNCSDVSPFQCVNLASAEDLAKSVYKMFEFGRDNPIYLWLPVVEPVNDQSFLTVDDPLEEIEAGRWARVPILMGTTRNEFASSAYELLQNQTQRLRWIDEFDRWAAVAFHFEWDTRISSNIREIYFKTNSSLIDFSQIQQCFADALAHFPVHRLATAASSYDTPVYRYRFDYRGRSTNFAPLDKSFSNIVEHLDDLQYLFGSKLWLRIAPHDGPDAAMVRRMTLMVANFAKSGNPSTEQMPEWPLFEQNQQWYVRIENQSTKLQYPFTASEQWDKWFP